MRFGLEGPVTEGSLESFIRKYSAQVEEPATAVLGILDRLSRASVLERVVDCCLGDEAWLKRAAARSYHHANGFDKLVLCVVRGPTRQKLRLHVWRPGEPVSEEQIHNHRWSFGTVMVCGSYELEIYRERQEEGVGMLEYSYRSPENAETFQMERVGRSRLVCVFRGRIGSGSSYYLEYRELHRVFRNEDGLVATLMLQTGVAKGNTRVFSKEGIDDTNVKSVRRFTIGEMKESLGLVRGAMG